MVDWRSLPGADWRSTGEPGAGTAIPIVCIGIAKVQRFLRRQYLFAQETVRSETNCGRLTPRINLGRAAEAARNHRW